VTSKSVPDVEPAAPAAGQPQQQQAQHRQVKAGAEAWGYVDVRPGAHMFYWLYYSTHAAGYLTRPLVIWLQGGPGASGCGIGNFEEIGPLDINLVERNTTWVKEANVLFIDNPVGSGYSYVDNPALFTTDVQQITDDLLTFIRAFMASYPEFKTIPLYVFGQSYGGKMGAHFCRQLYNEIQAGTAEVNLIGFAMGNSWISPIDSTMTWGPLLYQMSLVDQEGHDAIQRAAEACQRAVNEGRWLDATNLWSSTETVVLYRTHYVDFYNILNFVIPGAQRTHGRFNAILPDGRAADPLDALMNGPIREKLGIIPPEVIWGGQYDAVFNNQAVDFMKPVVSTVDSALMETTLQVIVYEGQLDLICDTVGTMNWVQQLTWPNLPNYNNASRVWFVNQDTVQTEMYVKAHDRFKFYWVLGAGHMVPGDNGSTAYRMLQRILGNMDT
jgi:serine carboxypeptidase 1